MRCLFDSQLINCMAGWDIMSVLEFVRVRAILVKGQTGI